MKSNIFFVRVYVAISVMNFLEYSDMNKIRCGRPGEIVGDR